MFPEAPGIPRSATHPPARCSPRLAAAQALAAAAQALSAAAQALAAVALVLAAAALTPPARALERVTLRNGFTYDCTRQEPLDNTHIRLFLQPSTTDAARSSSTGQASTAANSSAAANYIDLPSASVAGVEQLPDPPPLARGHTTGHTTGNSLDLRTLLKGAGAAHNVDVELLASIVHAESGGRVHALSRAGAVGLMQLMPATALSLGVLDPRLPEGNINGGTAYLDVLLTRYKNNLALALAAYNAGPGAVDRYGGIPPFRETRAYVARVMTEFKRRKLDLARNEHPPR